MRWADYRTNASYDELLTSAGAVRDAVRSVGGFLSELSLDALRARQRAAEANILARGVTFTVYGANSNIDREWPFDIIPRIIPAREWDRIALGLEQRLRALDHFVDDLYNDQRVIKAGVFPGELLATSKNYLPLCRGVHPKYGVWAHVCGTDLVRDVDGTVYVLEDNLRIPSGASYMLENRALTKRVFPELLLQQKIQPVDGYASRLYQLLASVAPDSVDEPNVVLLTPGINNSAYFEHCYLAQQMGMLPNSHLPPISASVLRNSATCTPIPPTPYHAFLDLKSRWMVPMHYGSFRLSHEPRTTNPCSCSIRKPAPPASKTVSW